ncbi:Crp/Fnr family transcriptional regulator [Roseomonas sp. 18066]|uniref:Crp/Fnr family transcriptional regulator n=1 Tax=Roseomonas sp. 18066 TaxID=2681412 RepID=UPI00135816B1|nr:Crp/Fnr family transcriptional regulator [Roseomonas sp. 18066]
MPHPADDTLRLLDRVSFLAPLPAASRQALAALARPQRLAEARPLFRRGDPGEGMILVLDGLVRLHLTSAAGRELTLGLAGQGEPVGELALIDGGPRSADATTLTPVSLLLFRHAEAAPLIERDGALAMALLRMVVGRLRRTTDQVEAVGLQPLPQRLAGVLLRLAAADPAGLVRLPQGQIAALVAATRPKVNLALAELRRQGLLVPARAGLRLQDLAALRAIAEG